ncbi:hypothetical protein SCUP515_08085 [Seiridium cupressi]
MLGFGRFNRPKSQNHAAPSEDNSVISPRPLTTPRVFTPPVLRNFSYPTSISAGSKSPAYPKSYLAETTIWDQSRVICNFSTDNSLKAGGADRDDPCFYNTDHFQYIRLDDQEEPSSTAIWNPSHPVHRIPPKEEPAVRKKQRRGTLLGLSIPQSHGTCAQSKLPTNIESSRTEIPKSQSLGEQISIRKTNVASRLKRSPLGQHKTVKSFDASHLGGTHRSKLVRPASSSGDPIIDTRMKNGVLESNSSSVVQSGKDRSIVSVKSVKNSQREATPNSAQVPVMEVIRRKASSQNASHNGRRSNDITTSSEVHKGKDGKGRWFSQIKEWISTSEPSNQALKNYKKDAFRRAGITPDDPRASAKLHIPTTTLPPEAIKPSGSGPDPEEVALKKAEQKRKLRQSFQTTASSSLGSRTSASQHSSLSSLALKDLRDAA